MSRRRLFGSLLGMVFLVHLARVVFAPLIDPLMATFDVGPGAAGLVATAVWLGSALPRVPVGYLLTRVERHHVIVGAGALLALAAAGAAFVPTIALLTAGALLMGIATGAYYIAANPLVSELYPDRVGQAMGTHYTSAQFASILAAPIVGVALALGDYRLVFQAIAVGALAVTATTALVARRADLPDAGIEDRDLPAAVRAQWPLLATGVAIIGTTGLAWNGTFNFLVTYLRVGKGLDPGTARALLTVVFVAGLPALPIAGRLADRVANVPLLIGIMLGFVASLFALLGAGGVVALAASAAAMGLVIHSLFPAIDAYVLSSLPDRHRASAYSAYSFTMVLCMSAGSTAVGTLVEAGFGYGAVLGGFGVGVAAVALALAALYAAGRVPRGGTAV